jgi:branched-chain amino acid transport system ATP-binding protein
VRPTDLDPHGVADGGDSPPPTPPVSDVPTDRGRRGAGAADPAAATSPQGAERRGGTLLDVRELESGYGEIPVLRGISFHVAAGETVVLLGLNGAGKTTTALSLCGELKPWAGAVRSDGEEVTGWSTKRAVRRGVVLVPEGRRVFPALSVEKNLEVGAWSRRRDRGYVENRKDVVFGYFSRLRERRGQAAGTLSGGEQQMLAIGRGLMADPRLLIIDEASLGLAPVIVSDVFDIVSEINDDGVTVIMIEQNLGALEVADVGLVMEQGTLSMEIRGGELKDPSAVRDALMG